jgi:hypothetical protein
MSATGTKSPLFAEQAPAGAPEPTRPRGVIAFEAMKQSFGEVHGTEP